MTPQRIARLPPRIASDAAPDNSREWRRVSSSDAICRPSGSAVPRPVPAYCSVTVPGLGGNADVTPARLQS